MMNTDYYGRRAAIKATSYIGNVGGMLVATPGMIELYKDVKVGMINKINSGLSYIDNAANSYKSGSLIQLPKAQLSSILQKITNARTSIAASSTGGKYTQTLLDCDTLIDDIQYSINNLNMVSTALGKISISIPSSEKCIASTRSCLAKTGNTIKRISAATSVKGVKILSICKINISNIAVGVGESLIESSNMMGKATLMTKICNFGGAMFAVFDLTATAMSWARNNSLISTFENTFYNAAKTYDAVIADLIAKGDFKKEILGNTVKTPYNPNVVNRLARFVNLDDNGCDAEYNSDGVLTKSAIPHTYCNTCESHFRQVISKLKTNNANVLGALIVSAFALIAAVVISVATFGIAAGPAWVGATAIVVGVLATATSITLTIVGCENHTSIYNQMTSAITNMNTLAVTDFDDYKVVIDPIVTTSYRLTQCQMKLMNDSNKAFLLPTREEILADFVTKLKPYSTTNSTTGLLNIIPELAITSWLPFMYMEANYSELNLYLNTVINGITDLYNSSGQGVPFLTNKRALLRMLFFNEMRDYIVVNTSVGTYMSLYNYVDITTSAESFRSNVGTSLSSFYSTKLKLKTTTMFARNVSFTFSMANTTPTLSVLPYYSECSTNDFVIAGGNPLDWTNAFCTGSSGSFRLNISTYNSIVNANADTNPVYQAFDANGYVIIPDIREMPLFIPVNRDSSKRYFTQTTSMVDNISLTNDVQFSIWRQYQNTWSKVNNNFTVNIDTTKIAATGTSQGGGIGC